MTPQELQKMGLSAKEAQIFNFMLDSTVDGLKVADISKKLEINTRNCSSYLTNMARKGFVIVVKKPGSRTRYFPGDPLKMQEKLDEENQDWKIRQHILQKMTSHYYKNRILKVDLFEGREDYEATKEIIDNVKSKLYVIDNSDERWHETKQKKDQLKHQYVNLTVSTHGEGMIKTGPVTTYHLPKNINTHGELVIAGDMIIITQPADKYIGAVITHKQTADNLRAIIELALPQAESIAKKRANR